MAQTYITGTHNLGSALQQFMPDYVDNLLHRGHKLITSNKRGVDEAILAHCETRQLPLHVIEFRNNSQWRAVQTDVHSIDVQTVETPTWFRFRHVAAQTEQVVFLHSAKTRGAVQDLSTYDALALACHKRGLHAEQHIVQKQHT